VPVVVVVGDPCIVNVLVLGKFAELDDILDIDVTGDEFYSIRQGFHLSTVYRHER
jgi:hypothetical protein